jgi:hypothetical protein
LQAQLGRRNIQHTVRFTRTKDFWAVADMGISQHKLEATRIARAVRVARTEARAADLAAIVGELRRAAQRRRGRSTLPASRKAIYLI